MAPSYIRGVLSVVLATLAGCASAGTGDRCPGPSCPDSGVDAGVARDAGDDARSDAGNDAAALDGATDSGPDATDAGPTLSDTFCPTAPTSRAQFARFAVRAVRPEFDPTAWVYRGTFSDVPATHAFAAEIEQLAEDGITTGCGDGSMFCPNEMVLRSQAAVFVTRIMRGPGFSPPAATGVYSDVPSGAFYAAQTEFLRGEGIMLGCTDTTFCPLEPLTRQQAAVVFVRLADGRTPDLPPYRGYFSDVPESNIFARFIERFADLGYTNGC